MHTLEKFLAGSALRLRCREVALTGNEGLLMADVWAAKHYRCELYGANGHRPVTAIMASDNGPPEVADVLDAVAAEAAVVDDTGSYEEWAQQMGFDADSRRGERIYHSERRQAKALRALLGEEAYRELLWETERL
ncbi:MAG TPA: hypothetical protein VG186_08290 [Solirubrobacteraceae bacterium]|jgi:hypothetical protein|nr:hypothetical protein [Solirubrobacteraceae bacterium]